MKTVNIQLSIEERDLLIDLIELLPVDLIKFMKHRQDILDINNRPINSNAHSLIEFINNKIITAPHK